MRHTPADAPPDLTESVFDRSIMDSVDFSGGSLNGISLNCSLPKNDNFTAVRLRRAVLNGALLIEPTFFVTDFTLREIGACPFDDRNTGNYEGAKLDPEWESLAQTHSRFNKHTDIRNENAKKVNVWPTVSEDDPVQVDVLAKEITRFACSHTSLAHGIWAGMNGSPRSQRIGYAIMEPFRAARNDPQCVGLKGWFNF